MCGFKGYVKEPVPSVEITRDSLSYTEPVYAIRHLTKDQIQYVIGALGTTLANDTPVGQATYEVLFEEAIKADLEINPVTLGLLKVSDLPTAEAFFYETIVPAVIAKSKANARATQAAATV